MNQNRRTKRRGSAKPLTCNPQPTTGNDPLKKPRRRKGTEKKSAILSVSLCAFVVSLLFFFAGCAYLTQGPEGVCQTTQGSLGLYVRFYSPSHEEISFTIKDIQVTRTDGTVISRPIDQSLEAGSDWRQVRFEVRLPAGSYQRAGLSFTDATLLQSGSPVSLESPQNYTFLDLSFLITPQGTTNAYINLEVKSQSKGAEGGAALLLSPRISQGRKPAGIKSLMLYVTNTADNTVSVLDRLTNSLISVIQVGRSPKGIVVNPRGTYAYVANSGSNTVSIIDTMTNELEPVEDTIDLPLGIAPSNMAITSDGKYLFTANTDSDNVSMIDTELKKVIETFGVGNKPVDLRVSPGGQWLYVANQGSHDIYVVNIELGRQLVDRIPLQYEPSGIAVAGDGFSHDRVFVSNFDSSSLSLFDINLGNLQGQGRSGNAQFTPGHSVDKSSILQGEYGPAQIVLDEDRGRLYVTNQKDNSVSSFVISSISSTSISSASNIQESRCQVGKRPKGLALDRGRNYLYVVNSAEDSLSVIDLRQERVVESIKVGNEPFGVDGIDLIRK